MVLRNNSVRLASCSVSSGQALAQRRGAGARAFCQRHALEIVVGEIHHDRGWSSRSSRYCGGASSADAVRQRQVVGIGRDQHRGEGLAGFAERRPDQRIAMAGRALDDGIEARHVLGRTLHLLVIGLGDGRLHAAQLAKTVEEALGGAFELLDRARQHQGPWRRGWSASPAPPRAAAGSRRTGPGSAG